MCQQRTHALQQRATHSITARLDNGKIGRFLAVENPAGVHAALKM
jgi:hypothetical protein